MVVDPPVALNEEELAKFEELARSAGLDFKEGVASSLTGLLALGAAPHSLQTVLAVIVQSKSTSKVAARRAAPSTGSTAESY